MKSYNGRTAAWIAVIVGVIIASSAAMAAELSSTSALWICRFLGALLGATVATVMLKRERSNLGVFGAASVSFASGMSAWKLVLSKIGWDIHDPADNWMAAFFAAAMAITIWRVAFGPKGITGWVQRLTGGKVDAE